MIEVKIYKTRMPFSTEAKYLTPLKEVIGNTVVDAYSLDDDYKIIKGRGCIKFNDSYDYHKNLDKSEEAMFFDGRERWFTLSEEKIKKLYNENANIIREALNEKLNEYPEL